MNILISNGKKPHLKYSNELINEVRPNRKAPIASSEKNLITNIFDPFSVTITSAAPGTDLTQPLFYKQGHLLVMKN